MEHEHGEIGLGGWLFLLLVLVAYGVAAVLDTAVAARALSFFAKVMYNVAPALGLVFVLLLVADLFFQPQWIRRNLGRGVGIKGWLIAMIGGVLAAGPIYPWFAFLRDLRGKGMHASMMAVFLYSRAIKLPLLPLMIHYFGAPFTIAFCLYVLAFSVVNGMVMLVLEKRDAR